MVTETISKGAVIKKEKTISTSIIIYESVSISNRSDLFLTDWPSQDFHKLFGRHIKTYVQSLSIIGLLVDNWVKWFSFVELGCYVNCTIWSIYLVWKLQCAYVIWASAWDFQQCGILTCVDSDEPVQPPFKLRNSKWCSVSS